MVEWMLVRVYTTEGREGRLLGVLRREGGRWHDAWAGGTEQQVMAKVMKTKQGDNGSVPATGAPFIVFPLPHASAGRHGQSELFVNPAPCPRGKGTKRDETWGEGREGRDDRGGVHGVE